MLRLMFELPLGKSRRLLYVREKGLVLLDCKAPEILEQIRSVAFRLNYPLIDQRLIKC